MTSSQPPSVTNKTRDVEFGVLNRRLQVLVGYEAKMECVILDTVRILGNVKNQEQANAVPFQELYAFITLFWNQHFLPFFPQPSTTAFQFQIIKGEISQKVKQRALMCCFEEGQHVFWITYYFNLDRVVNFGRASERGRAKLIRPVLIKVLTELTQRVVYVQFRKNKGPSHNEMETDPIVNQGFTFEKMLEYILCSFLIRYDKMTEKSHGESLDILKKALRACLSEEIQAKRVIIHIDLSSSLVRYKSEDNGIVVREFLRKFTKSRPSKPASQGTPSKNAETIEDLSDVEFLFDSTQDLGFENQDKEADISPASASSNGHQSCRAEDIVHGNTQFNNNTGTLEMGDFDMPSNSVIQEVPQPKPIEEYTEYYISTPTDKDRVDILVHIKTYLEMKQAYIFCKTAEDALLLSSMLSKRNVNCAYFSEPVNAVKFLDGSIRILILTEGTKLSKEFYGRVSVVINFNYCEGLNDMKRRLLAETSEEGTATPKIISLIKPSEEEAFRLSRPNFNLQELIFPD